MITADEIKKLDEQAYSIMLERDIEIDRPIIKLEDVHDSPWGELTQHYLMSAEDWTFSIDEVRRIHALSNYGKDELSEYKKRENAFVSKDSGYVAFIPALPEETAQAMNLWYEKYRSYNNLEYIIEAELDFEAIHPFEDGNGRTGYFLMRAMMRSIGYRCALHLNIDKFVYDRYMDNARAIQKSAGRGWGLQTVDYSYYMEFMLEILEASYNQLISILEA